MCVHTQWEREERERLYTYKYTCKCVCTNIIQIQPHIIHIFMCMCWMLNRHLIIQKYHSVNYNVVHQFAYLSVCSSIPPSLSPSRGFLFGSPECHCFLFGFSINLFSLSRQHSKAWKAEERSGVAGGNVKHAHTQLLSSSSRLPGTAISGIWRCWTPPGAATISIQILLWAVNKVLIKPSSRGSRQDLGPYLAIHSLWSGAQWGILVDLCWVLFHSVP